MSLNVGKLLNDYQLYASTSYEVGDCIFEEGGSIEGVHFILEGSVKLKKKHDDITLPVWYAHEEEFIGITSFFCERSNYSFTAEVTQETNVVFIPNTIFNQILIENPKFKQLIISSLVYRIKYTEYRLKTFKSKSIKQRFVQAVLLNRKNTSATKTGSKLKYSLSELAELIGSSKRHVQRLMNEFQKADVLKVEERFLTILNMELFTSTVK